MVKGKKALPFSENERRQIGSRMRKMRINSGMRQYDVAKLLGYSSGHYAKIESGNNPFSERVVQAFAEKMGIRKAWLLKGEGAPSENDEVRESRERYQDREFALDKTTDIRLTYEIMNNSSLMKSVEDISEQLGLKKVDVVAALVVLKLRKGE